MSSSMHHTPHHLELSMTLPRDVQSPGELQHVIARGVFGDRLAPNGEWGTELYNAIAREAHERQWQVWSLCIMGTHYHLLVSTPDNSLSVGLQRAHVSHAIRRNGKEAERRGAVFGRPFDVFPIRDDRHLRNTLRYIPLNPVAAGLCADPADWAFGTYRALAGLEACPRWVPKSRIFRSLEGMFSDRHDPWFSEADYRGFCGSQVNSPEPPQAIADWNRYDAQCMREDGKSSREIADRLGITIRHARRLSDASGHSKGT
ncbi:MAG: hypothetical protein EXQ67_05935 [Thermoleophilia bacterium]|nr:hypothetical protein [Thermoleophilia bacterium]